MYQGYPVICTICARGGSKGIPKKNIRELCGYPLIYHTIKIARECSYIDDIIVSTDDDEIAATAESYGIPAPFKRPEELASDSAAKIPAIRHAVVWAEKNWKKVWDIVVDLSVVSPLRNAEDIKNAIELLVETNGDNVFSVTQPYRNPYFNMVEVAGERVRLVKEPEKPFFRRQDAPEVYDMNDSIYVWWKKVLMYSDTVFNNNAKIYIMPRERSIDIDNEMDFLLVQFLMEHKRKGQSF